MNDKLFFPIDKDNLADYFASALIKPAKFFANRSKDIQNHFDHSLLLSTCSSIDNSNCALELVLTDDDEEYLFKLSENCWLFKKPLPITRVKKIVFDDPELRKHIISVIELNTAFIPEELIEEAKEFTKATSNEWKADNYHPLDFSNQIKTFNSLLGSLAMMRLARTDGMNFSENYFSLLAKYNTKIDKQLKNAGREIKRDLFKEGYYETVNRYIIEKIDDKILSEVLKSENQILKINNKTKRQEINSLEDASYIIAILRNYKANDNDEGRDNIDSLILQNFQNIKDNKSEEVAFYYGYNRGYDAFTKSYKKIQYKYDLNSQLDYYTIESIYQKTINGSDKNEEFPYLDSWCANKSDKISGKSFSKYDNEYIILDTIVIGKERPKVGSPQYIKERLVEFNKLSKELIEKLLNGQSLPLLLQTLLEKVISKISEDKEFEFEARMYNIEKDKEEKTKQDVSESSKLTSKEQQPKTEEDDIKECNKKNEDGIINNEIVNKQAIQTSLDLKYEQEKRTNNNGYLENV